MLETGVSWRVGDGSSIRIWHDAWLGAHGLGKIITPIRILDSNATVDSLIDRSNRKWKLDVITEIFLPLDAERISQIPISLSSAPDEKVWVASEDGRFRSRDMYSLALRSQLDPSCSTGSDPIWQKSWKLRIQPKARIFIWRAAWDILPHGSNPSKKGIKEVLKCHICGTIEDNLHVLRDCSWARQVWRHFIRSNEIPQLFFSGMARVYFGQQDTRRSGAFLFVRMADLASKERLAI